MKINYKLIKKIHSYACLATVALLLMFIFTSYMMIYHDWFDNEAQTETKIVDVSVVPASEEEWSLLAKEHRVSGRLTGTQTNPVGEVIRNYATAAGFTRLTYQPDQGKMEITHTDKSKANAIIGIHRQRGYGDGPLQYNVYALLLDILAISLIIFTITGIIMWFRLLKNDKWAWVIFVAGFIYFGFTLLYLTYV
jgi:hypothetical protein